MLARRMGCCRRRMAAVYRCVLRNLWILAAILNGDGEDAWLSERHQSEPFLGCRDLCRRCGGEDLACPVFPRFDLRVRWPYDTFSLFLRPQHLSLSGVVRRDRAVRRVDRRDIRLRVALHAMLPDAVAQLVLVQPRPLLVDYRCEGWFELPLRPQFGHQRLVVHPSDRLHTREYTGRHSRLSTRERRSGEEERMYL